VDLVSSKDQIATNLLLFDSYRSSQNSAHHSYYCDRLRLGKILVFSAHQGKYLFCPSRFAGYKNCTSEKHQAFPYKNGSITTPAISKILGKASENLEAESSFLALCEALKIAPSTKQRTYWRIELDSEIVPHQVTGGEPGFPDEMATYVEGASRRVVVNAYERNKEARLACIAHHGCKCAVCGFNFEAIYGQIGQGFIHVHHLTPISSIAADYTVNPITELRPVCPNCHAMLHKSDPPFSIEELKEILEHGNDTLNPSAGTAPSNTRDA